MLTRPPSPEARSPSPISVWSEDDADASSMASSSPSDVVPALTRGNSIVSSTSSAQTSMASSVIGEGFVLESHDDVLTVPDRYQIDADLVCPFQILDCERVFADIRHFKVHVFSHFKGHELPTSASCFLCDRKFANGPEDDAAQAWNAVLSHLAHDHYRRGQRLATVRTDFELMRETAGSHEAVCGTAQRGVHDECGEKSGQEATRFDEKHDHKEKLDVIVAAPPGGNNKSYATATANCILYAADRELFGIRRQGSSNNSMSVGEIFADAQRSNVGHKTLAKRLRRLENKAGFEGQIKQSISRLLEVSKSEVAGQRVVKFVTVYFQDADGSDATTTAVLLNLLPYTCAKDRTVRYRATQLVAQILAVLSAIDDDLYRMIRHELIKRLYDKVPATRLEAAGALGRIVENELDSDQEGHDSDEEAAPTLLDKLLDVLQNDSNADVRRKLLLNLPITPNTLPYLLERARDKDAATRRALYSRLLPKLGDFRHLSVSMREKLLRWGLRDRDEQVRKATARLFSERWIEDCASTKAQASDASTVDDKLKIHDASIPALLELLERIDIMNSGAENGVGTDAMREFWKARPDYVDAVAFEDDFWDKLSPESAFMARTFITFVCQSDADQRAREEDRIPEVTRIGFYMQKHLNTLLDSLRAKEEDNAEQEFIVEQLLHIAHQLDYTDEIGRRKMFTLLREAISTADLPEEITRLAVEGLRLVCNPNAAGEREFTSVILEAIAEVHDTILPPPPKEEEQKAVKTIMVNLKCLHIAQCMLENIRGSLQGNVHLESMLSNLVIPAIRSYEIPVRERGVLCLGLCCLLEPKLAVENTPLFVHCINREH
ncbi:hypothetical protein DV737_g3255, partial [Chaetothyriales sp. CBS 132003]